MTWDTILGDLGYPCWDHRTEWRMERPDDEDWREWKARALKAEAAQSKAEYELRRWKEAAASRPDWEKLWEEQSDRADKAEAALAREKYAYDVAQEQRTAFKERLDKAEAVLREIVECSENSKGCRCDEIYLLARAALPRDKGGK